MGKSVKEICSYLSFTKMYSLEKKLKIVRSHQSTNIGKKKIENHSDQSIPHYSTITCFYKMFLETGLVKNRHKDNDGITNERRARNNTGELVLLAMTDNPSTNLIEILAEVQLYQIIVSSDYKLYTYQIHQLLQPEVFCYLI